jgi:hypothetical protein
MRFKDLNVGLIDIAVKVTDLLAKPVITTLNKLIAHTLTSSMKTKDR